MIDSYIPTPANPGRILIVDDLIGNLKVHERELRNLPFNLTLVQSGDEALEVCSRLVFEGILMDVSLPGMDGIEACRQIRRSQLNATTPLIFISAVRIGEDWVKEGIDSGGIDYLVKPYVFSELLVKLRMMVRLSRQRDAALAGERNRALLEVAGGTAHELAQPLASAQILLDRFIKSSTPPTPSELRDLRDCLESTNKVLNQIQNLHTYITKPYASGRILDLALSSRQPFQSPITDPADQD
ncbi:response regulator [Geothrix sp. 21YS21S-2]|uniref:response regulator n=1 Tax=Geothrix sp. 21YS21S-2 TaxID=3068893 RepID=UPI0027B98372|nr:response regulator [Geothrix sp. 21YS21S-2]